MATRSKQRPRAKMKVRGLKARRTRRPGTRRPGSMTALLAVLAVGAVVAAALSVGADDLGVQVSERTVQVERGVIETLVSGSGNLEPVRQADLSFATSGRITKIYTSEGEHVSKGELLARIDDRAARVALAKAQAELVDAQDALGAAQDATTTSAATASAATARAAAASDAAASAAGAPEATPAAALAAASAAATRAPAAAIVAQASPAPAGTPGASATPTPSASAAPPAAATAAPTRTPAATAVPQTGGGGSAQSVESAEAAVASAQLALDEAEDALAATELRAPMAGTVAALNGAVGDTAGASGGGEASQDEQAASTSSAFITLAALSRLKLEVALSEADIGKVQVGQSVTVSVNAASGEQVAGQVASVGVLSSTSTSGSVSYPVVVTVDQSAEGIRAGMSATADIVVDRATGLAVPSQALRGSSVTVDRGGRRETRRVQTGVVGERMTEVVSGLEAGETVVITSTSAIQGAVTNAQGAGQRGATGLGGLGGGGAARGGFGGSGGGFAPPGAGGGGFGGARGGP
ncbi:macrolide-specific efflux system membrane fusion protein [Solirubrobacter pauli]|uniref:Macrolide-specific efflux system membrane fusion protein n=1 Tax=Solirubrobacter pauli TaxID=166793 RepID=A0A660KX79_9ACTN|nr:HlyD family efflux transporter periplasmic adaptor subunit [Solirubrobacter pauli]RKQ86321.1 macrolide-specific efflux system membrane fusion protein [Solirubrobacter pauli]